MFTCVSRSSLFSGHVSCDKIQTVSHLPVPWIYQLVPAPINSNTTLSIYYHLNLRRNVTLSPPKLNMHCHVFLRSFLPIRLPVPVPQLRLVSSYLSDREGSSPKLLVSYLNDPHEGTPEERFLEYMRVLFTDIAVLHSFLLELSPGHVICHDWDVLGDEEQATRIADFISPNEFVAGCVKSSLMRTARHRPANVIPLPFDGGDAIVARLQRKLDAFEEVLCGPKRSA